jgi:hypothetical protein
VERTNKQIKYYNLTNNSYDTVQTELILIVLKDQQNTAALAYPTKLFISYWSEQFFVSTMALSFSFFSPDAYFMPVGSSNFFWGHAKRGVLWLWLLELISSESSPMADSGPDLRPDRGCPTQQGWWAPVTQYHIRGSGGHGLKTRGSPSCHPLWTLADLEGGAASDGKSTAASAPRRDVHCATGDATATSPPTATSCFTLKPEGMVRTFCYSPSLRCFSSVYPK